MKSILVILMSFPFFLCAQNVGINNPNPNEKLDVNGNINVTGTIKANGAAGSPNQVLMKDNGGNMVWSNSPYPASASDTSQAFLSFTSRNQWITDPGISLTVPDSGKYLLSFYGSMFNNNQTFTNETIYDSEGQIRVFNQTTNAEIFSTSAVTLYIDNSTSFPIRKYLSLRPSFTIMANLAANDILTLQYFQAGFGAPFLTGAWNMGAGGIFILKIGN